MEKSSGRSGGEEKATICKNIPESHVSATIACLRVAGVGKEIPPNCQQKDFYSQLFRGILHIQLLEPGRLTCLFSVQPAVSNYYGGLHGGAVAAIVEVVSIACARTMVAENKQLFLGELSMSYLSAAPADAEVIVDASVVRSGRNVTVIAVAFKLKKTGKLVYTGRATFYNIRMAKL